MLLNYEKDKFRFAQASGREETMSTIRDISLAPLGHKRIEWVKDFMPVLSTLRERFVREQPFRGLRISVCVHLEAKTAYLALVLRDGGATVSVTGSNPLSTKDDICAALVEDGMDVHAFFGATEEEYYEHIRRVLEFKPHIIIDDGGEFVTMLTEQHPEYAECLIGGCEETTTGIHDKQHGDRAHRCRCRVRFLFKRHCNARKRTGRKCYCYGSKSFPRT